MKMPRAHQGYVQRAKITEYLLSPTHRVGRGKAGFFHRFGFQVEHWQVLQEALRTHAQKHDLAEHPRHPVWNLLYY